MIENRNFEKLALLNQLIAAIQEFESLWNSAVSTLEDADQASFDKAA